MLENNMVMSSFGAKLSLQPLHSSKVEGTVVEAWTPLLLASSFTVKSKEAPNQLIAKER